jgi:hypothetical protein
VKHCAILVIALAIACVSPIRAAKLVIEPAYPVRGEITAVRVAPDNQPDAVSLPDSAAATRAAEVVGWKIYVEYFPNSKVMRDDTLGITGAAGEIFWRPTFSGIVAVRASKPAIGGSVQQLSSNVSVKFPGVPPGGILVFFVAGIVLLGGAGWSIIHLLEHKPPADE